jgi:hypothetical protein
MFFLGGLAGQADAATISPQNPYRSFNISGVNYGSMQWEKQHRQTNRAYHRKSGRVYWRR